MNSVQTPDATGDPEGSLSHIATASQYIALAAILLPSIGYVERLSALLVTPRVTSELLPVLAGGQSIPDLVSYGVILALPIAFGVAYGTLRDTKSPSYDAPVTRGQDIYLKILLAVFVLVAFLFSFWFLTSYLIPIWIAVSEIFWLRRQGKFDSSHAWIVPVTVALVAGVSAGLFTGTAPSGEVYFAPQAHLSNGLYVILATTGNQSYLLSCALRSNVISVDASAVDHIRYVSGNQSDVLTGFYTLIFEHKHFSFGLASGCPASKGKT